MDSKTMGNLRKYQRSVRNHALQVWRAKETTKKQNEEQGVKSLNLILTPATASAGEQITPSASCSPNCKGKKIFFKEYSLATCSGKQVSFCVSSDSGCTGLVFDTPSQSGVHGYVACLDRNGDNNFNGEEESSKSVPLVVKPQ